jgi:uncharacterized repeat protein (TIGR01451 family)
VPAHSRLSRAAICALAMVIALIAALPSPGPVRAAPGADMVVQKEASVSQVPVDGEFTYTITASNVGTATAQHVRVRDTRIDPALVVTAGPTTTGGLSCEIDPQNNLLCRKATMAPGTSATVTFTVRAPEAACVFIGNRAVTAASNEPAANTGNNVSAAVAVRMTGCPPDTTPPTGSIVINGGQPVAWGPLVQLSLVAQDDRTGDRSLVMRVSNSAAVTDGLLVHTVTEGYLPVRRWSLSNAARGGTASLGLKRVHAQYRDRDGNWSPVFSDGIRMRADAPNRCATATSSAPRALNFTFGETVYPSVDSDWFKFRLRARRAVVIRLGSQPANLKLLLAGRTCNLLASSDHVGTAPEVIRRTLAAGTYFVRVAGATSRTQSVRPYTIRFDTSP